MTSPASPIDWSAILGELAVALLGEPNAALSNRRELHYGRRGCFAVHIAGAYAGTFRDHEAGEGGGVLDLMRHARGDDLMGERQGQVWAGTPTALYDELTQRLGEPVPKTQEWPVNAQMLSRSLNRITPSLRPAGVTIDRQKSGQRLIQVTATPEAGC